MSHVFDAGELVVPLWWVAKALKWRTEKASRKFVAAGLAFQTAPHSEWYIAETTVARFFPGLLLRIGEMKARGEFRMPGRARHGERNGRRRAACSHTQA